MIAIWITPAFALLHLKISIVFATKTAAQMMHFLVAPIVHVHATVMRTDAPLCHQHVVLLEHVSMGTKLFGKNEIGMFN